MIDSRIAMMGQQPNLVNALAQGTQAAGQVAALRRQAEGQNLFRQHGAGMVQGDPTAMNALAGFSPETAFSMKNQRAEQARADRRLQISEEQLGMAREAAAKSVREAADKRLAAAEVQKAQGIYKQAVLALENGDQAGWQAATSGLGMELPMDSGSVQLMGAMLGGAAEEVGKLYAGSEQDQPTTQSAAVLEDGTTIMPMKDGTVLVRNGAGEVLEGQSRVDAIMAARTYEIENERQINAARVAGRNTAEAATGAEAAAAGERGKQGIKMAAEFFQDRRNVSSSLRNIRDGIRAIDEGAKAGIVYNMIPNVTAASASLKNTMNKMGLDVIGSVTFGALSEGEMRLAMETAVPQELDAPKLREWLMRKAEAQEKALEGLEDAIEHFDGGGSMAEWVRKVGKMSSPTTFDDFIKTHENDPDIQDALGAGVTLEMIWENHPDNPGAQ